jgi:hypothetical protein
MKGRVDAVRTKLASVRAKAIENCDDAHDLEAAGLETRIKAVQDQIEQLLHHPAPEQGQSSRPLLANKTQAETDADDLDKNLASIDQAIVPNPDCDPRRPDPARWMAGQADDFGKQLAAVIKDEGEDGPDVAALKQSVLEFTSKLEEERAKKWNAEGATPDERRQAQADIRKGVDAVNAKKAAITDSLTNARKMARQRLKTYLDEQVALNDQGKVVTPQPLKDAFKAGIDSINLNDPNMGGEAVRTKVARITEWVKGLENDLPASAELAGIPEGEVKKGIEAAITAKREMYLKAATEPMTGGRRLPGPEDVDYATSLARWKTEYSGFLTGVKQILADAAELERLLSLGYGFEDQDGGKSIKSLSAGVRQRLEGADIRPAVENVLRKAADLEQVTGETDPVRLMGTISAAGGGAGLSALTTAWARLPKFGFPTVGNLGQAAELLNTKVLPALATVPDQVRRTKLETDARNAAKEMWFSCVHDRAGTTGKPEIVVSVFEAAPQFGIGPDDLKNLEPWAFYNYQRWTLLKDITPLSQLKEDDQKKGVMEKVAAFNRFAAGQKDVAKRKAVTDMATKLDRFEKGKVLDLTQEGPGKAGWTADIKDPDSKVVVYSWSKGAAHQSLEFRRVVESADAAGYLCTTEASLGLCMDLIGNFGKWTEFAAQTSKPAEGEDERPGPRVWLWTPDGKMMLSVKTTPADSTGLGWHRPDSTGDMERLAYYPPDKAPKDVPQLGDPVDFISPAAAVYISRLINCRIPSTAEWTAAEQAYHTTKPNLRDQTWADQHAYIDSIYEKSNRHANWPNDSMLRPAKGFNLGQKADAAPATTDNDGALYFVPVSSGGGDYFHHLIGNVWEFVYDEDAGSPNKLDTVGATAKDIKAVLGKGERVHAIGGSALSPKELDPTKPLDFKWNDAAGGFSDAGFRLAFSTGGGTGGAGKLAESLAKLLTNSDYLTKGEN